jgi:flagellar basal body P-ring protein FlgI
MNHTAKIFAFSLKRTALMVLIGGLVGLLAGCQKGGMTLSTTQSSEDLSAQKAEAERSAMAGKTAPLSGTIGSATYLEGMRSMYVQGYGLVVGLPGTGSSECPEALRRELMGTIAKNQRLYGERGRKQGGQAGVIIDSRDTAVVKVSGYIPYGAVKGDRFDLMVESLPNTGTISLEGGRLYATELRIYAGSYSGQNNSSRILAEGSGPIFINPFEKKQNRGVLQLKRKGYILNGGENQEDRRLHLMLYQPSYGTARAIEQRINSIFGPPSDDPLWQTAKAVGPDRIELHIPRDYRGQLDHFLSLVRSLYTRSDPGYIESQANQLARDVSDPMANPDAISFAWEGMGRSMLPLIQPLYASSSRQAAFYAARAGARLGDSVAMELLGGYALDPKSTYRKKAVLTLGYCKSVSARRVLRKVVDDEDIDLRILAYEGLARLNDGTVSRRFVGEDNLILDEVCSQTWPLVYVTRSAQPKVVLFGPLQLEPPIFYCHPDDSVTISADAKANMVALIRKSPSGKSSGRIDAGLALAPLIGFLGNDANVRGNEKVTGLGLPYSHVVAILNQLCKDGSISARFKLQELTEIVDPADDIIGRPEKD